MRASEVANFKCLVPRASRPPANPGWRSQDVKSQTNSREGRSPTPLLGGGRGECQQVSEGGKEEQHTESRKDFHEIESMRGGAIEMIPGRTVERNRC